MGVGLGHNGGGIFTWDYIEEKILSQKLSQKTKTCVGASSGKVDLILFVIMIPIFINLLLKNDMPRKAVTFVYDSMKLIVAHVSDMAHGPLFFHLIINYNSHSC